MKCYEFIRGDTFSFKTRIKLKDGSFVTKDDLKTLIVTVRRWANDNAPIAFQKTLDDVSIDTEKYIHIVFEPKDTEGLETDIIYPFDIEITTKGGIRKTKKGSFKLEWDATTHKGE